MIIMLYAYKDADMTDSTATKGAAPDRELLEWAAKAIGRRVVGWNEAQGEDVAVMDDGGFWQPLHRNRITDSDGDALRLAVRLGIGVLFDLQYETVTAYEQAPHDGYHVEVADELEPLAATRRAIVRAAAAIGKAMG